MKNIQSQTANHNTKFNNNKHRPENKDDLDSRENLEQQFKGNDITHNRKEVRNNPQKKKK